jgi:type I site-specific restriction-modification system R (restriction) subunit
MGGGFVASVFHSCCLISLYKTKNLDNLLKSYYNFSEECGTMFKYAQYELNIDCNLNAEEVKELFSQPLNDLQIQSLTEEIMNNFGISYEKLISVYDIISSEELKTQVKSEAEQLLEDKKNYENDLKKNLTSFLKEHNITNKISPKIINSCIQKQVNNCFEQNEDNEEEIEINSNFKALL